MSLTSGRIYPVKHILGTIMFCSELWLTDPEWRHLLLQKPWGRYSMHKIKTVQPDWSLSVKSFWYKNDWKAKLYNVQVGYTSSGQHNQCPQGMEKKKKKLLWRVTLLSSKKEIYYKRKFHYNNLLPKVSYQIKKAKQWISWLFWDDYIYEHNVPNLIILNAAKTKSFQ